MAKDVQQKKEENHSSLRSSVINTGKIEIELYQ